LSEFYDLDDMNEILKKMQDRKGGSMFEFLCQFQNDLSILATEQISQPLRRCKEIIEAQI
jgi:hypothetical protein